MALSSLTGQSRGLLPEDAAKARVLLVDVRPADGRSDAPKSARHVPLAALRESLKALPASKPLVFVDEDGRLAYLASRVARGRGRADAGYVSGGLRAWRAAGLPTSPVRR